MLDLGTGSGILAMAAASLLHRPVLATDIDPWSVRVTRENAQRNGLGRRLRCRLADGWGSPAVRGGRATTWCSPTSWRGRCAGWRKIWPRAGAGRHGDPGRVAGDAGALVLAAHRRQGLVLEATLRERDWATLVLRKR